MTPYPGLQYLTWAVYLVIFGLVLAKAVRTPTRAHWDMVMFFGAPTLIIIVSAIEVLLGLRIDPWVTDLTTISALALPYLLMRLVEAFADVPGWLLRGAELGLIAIAILVLISPADLPNWLVAVAVAYFGAVAVYDASAFIQQALRSRGVTRRRMQAIAIGTGLVTLDVLAAGAAQVFPVGAGVLLLVGSICGVASGIAYYVGFAPPMWLRFAAQAPELRAFLERAAHLPFLHDEREVVGELERGAALTLGSQTAALGLWHPSEGALRFYSVAGLEDMPAADLQRFGAARTAEGIDFAPDRLLVGTAFTAQRPLLSIDPARDDPRDAGLYRALGIRAVLAAPLSVRERQHGVLTMWSHRSPMFAEGDLELVQLLASQAAMVLEIRALLDETAQARARRAADALKDEFLASMSHDLRNPLTAVSGVAQILERRLQRTGSVEIERLTVGLQSIGAAAHQMSYLIDQIMDAARIGANRPLELEIRPTDLVALAETAVATERQLSERHTLRLDASEPSLTGQWDPRRLQRVLQNLLSNAIKYSPEGGDVLVTVERERSDAGDWAVLSVRDQGIGVPEQDVPHIFERFHRGSNVADRITGSGIGLATARQVAEQHGGTLRVESREGEGSTFTLRLPIGNHPAEPPTGDDISPSTEPGLEIPSDIVPVEASPQAVHGYPRPDPAGASST